MLTDFTPAEAAILGKWLVDTEKNSKALLNRVLYWTGGHPYLTQRLCQAVTVSRRAIRPANVDRLCEELFLTPQAQDQDDNLSVVREQMLRDDEERPSLLGLYGRARRGRRVRAEESNSLVGALQRSGITRAVKGKLRVRNRIYARVFDKAWVQSNMPQAGIRRPRFVFPRFVFPRRLWRPIAIVGGVLAMLIIFGVIAWKGQAQVKGVVARAQGLFSQLGQSEGEQPSPAQPPAQQQALRTEKRARKPASQIRPSEQRKPSPAQPREQQQASRTEERTRKPASQIRPSEQRKPSPAQPPAQKPVSQRPASDRKLSPRIQAKLNTQSPEKRSSLRLRRYGKPLQHEDRVNAVVFSPDGRLLATASQDTTVRLWDVSGSKEQVPPFPHRVFQHQSGVLYLTRAPFPNL